MRLSLEMSSQRQVLPPVDIEGFPFLWRQGTGRVWVFPLKALGGGDIAGFFEFRQVRGEVAFAQTGGVQQVDKICVLAAPGSGYIRIDTV